MVGKNLSHYRILEELGRGGMGIVYKAEDTKLDRTVAIKVLPPAALASEDDRARFYREAKAAAQLHHPHIASVFEIDEAVPEASKDDDLRPFIAMEYIEGETLDDHIKKGPLKLEEAVRIASQIASGLEAAHEKNIVHRDLKSQNVMLTKKGEAKILDFGLAQTAASTKLTRMGSTMGTVAYMSPEQARGEEVDLRTDLWSLGVVLYEMISGRHPFPGDYEQAVVYEILNQDPEPLTALRTGVPMEVERIVSKCISKDEKKRYQHADDLIADLAAADLTSASGSSTLLESSEIATHNRRSIWVNITFAIAGGTVAILLYSILNPTPANQNSLSVQDMNRLTIESVVEMWPAIHPNGDQVVYASGTIDEMRLNYRLIDGGPPNPLIAGWDFHQAHPTYSPNGSQVLFESGGSIYTVESLGGTPRPVARPVSGGNYSFPAWSPDGSQIVFTNMADSIFVQNLDDNQKTLGVASNTPNSPSWSPDGKYIAFVRGNILHARLGANIAPSSIWIIRVKDGELFQFSGNEDMNLSPQWSPDSGHIYYISNQGGGTDVYRREFKSFGSRDGREERLTTGLNLHSIDLSADGLRIVGGTLDYSQNIWSISLDSDQIVSVKDAIPITSGDQVIEGVAVSPDGSRIGYSSNVKGISNIYVKPLFEGYPLQITSGEVPDFVYDWSPIGDVLAFHTFVDGSREIYTVSVDDLTETSVTDDSRNDALPIWLGDINTLGFVRDISSDPKFVVARRSEDGMWGRAEVLVSEMNPTGSWSSVHNSFVYEADNMIKIFSPETGDTREVFRPTDRVIKSGNTENFNPLWSDDGNTVYFASRDESGNHGFFSVPAAGGDVKQIVSFEGMPRGVGRATIHGNNIYFTMAEVESDVWVLELSDK